MPRIFISYSRKDKPRADELVAQLRRVYNREDVWMDDRMNFGQEFWQEILREIQQTEIFLFLLSPDALESQYCRAELKEAARLQKPILPVQIASVAEPLSDKAQAWKTRLDKILTLDATAGFTADSFARLQESIRELVVRKLPPASPSDLAKPMLSAGGPIRGLRLVTTPSGKTDDEGGGKPPTCTIIIVAVLVSLVLVTFLVFGSGIRIVNVEGNSIAIGDFVLNMIFPGRITATPTPTSTFTPSPTPTNTPTETATTQPVATTPAAIDSPTPTPLPESTSDSSPFRSVSASGNIDSGSQEDRYTFTGRAGDWVRVVTIATSGALNPTPAIRSDNNATVCEGSVTMDVLDCQLPADGTYIASVYDFFRNETGAYQIIIQRLNSPDDCRELQPGETITGNITSAAQQDCYTISGSAGYNLRVTTTASSGSLNPTPAIYQADGTLVCEGSVTTDTLECTLPAVGQFTIFVYDFWRKETGSYTLAFS